MYHQDWLMRQIEIIAETLARVLFRKTPARRADVLYERLDPDDRDGLAAALRFYSALNALPDAELEARNFPRDEILSGLTDVCRRCGLEDVLHVLPGGEDEPRFDA